MIIIILIALLHHPTPSDTGLLIYAVLTLSVLYGHLLSFVWMSEPE